MKKKLIYILVLIIVIPCALDAFCYWIDPLGLSHLAYSLNVQARLKQADNTGFVLPDGAYRWHYFTVTIRDGWRVTPDTSLVADCTIVFIGDSVTFGYGVDDNETFVNQFAQRFPDVYFQNGARHGYNIGNITSVKQSLTADGYIYLVVPNDALPDTHYESANNITDIPALSIYLLWILQGKRQQAVANYNRYFDTLPQIVDENTLLIGFQDDPLALAIDTSYPILLIPSYTEQVSWIDGHPNAQGHLQIANALTPTLTRFVSSKCGG